MTRIFRIFLPLFLLAAWPAAALDVGMDAVRQAFEEMPEPLRRSAQDSLRDAGFYPGVSDGLWGPGTQAAYDALADDPVFEAAAPRMRVVDIPEELVWFPFAGEFSEGFLGFPFYEEGDDCDTCDFNEADLVVP